MIRRVTMGMSRLWFLLNPLLATRFRQDWKVQSVNNVILGSEKELKFMDHVDESVEIQK